VRKITGFGRGRWRMLSMLVLAGIAAGTIGLSPVFGGALSGASTTGAFETTIHNHASTNRDARADQIREARCANKSYRLINYSSCGKITPARAKYQRAQRARCARVRYRKAHPLLCPRIRGGVHRIAAVGEGPQTIGAWTGRISIPGLAINSVLLPTGKVLWWAYPEKDTWYQARTGQDPEAVNYAEAYVFDPATGVSVRRDPPINPETGKPFNIWCAGQTLLSDGRLVVAGGNFHYYGWNGINKYMGLDVVLTFNPFTETWTYQGRMHDGRWYPTLTELADGRVAIVGGLSKDPNADNNDVELFTPSPDINGVGSIQVVGQQGFGLYPHMFLMGDGNLRTIGPQTVDSHVINKSNFSSSASQPLPFRREWGFATLLPSGPGGPTTMLVQGGSDIDKSQTADGYGTAPPPTSTILVDLATGAQTPGPPNIRPRSHLQTRILPDGTLLTIGGGAGTVDNSLYAGPVMTAELFNPATGTWTETNPQVDARTYHSTALLIPDGRVISMGDDRQIVSDNGPNGGNLRTVEYYSPPYLYKGARPTISSAPAGAPYNAPVGIGTPDAAGISKAVLLKLGATTHATDADQRELQMPVSQVTGGVQFTTPASPDAAPPGYYMLFLVNGQGVPSVAKMIRIDSGLPVPSGIATPGGGGGAAAVFTAPRVSKISATWSVKGRKAVVRVRLRASKAFKGSVKLFPLGKKIKGKAARKLVKKPYGARAITGRGGKKVTATIRFSLKGKRFPLKLRMTIGVKDKRGGPTRTITKGLLLKKAPKTTARILAKAR
jgi:Galactose oxidase-like, Early set domain